MKWTDELPDDRLALQRETRARVCPPVNPVPLVDDAPAVLRYLWYHNLSPKERRKVDRENEEMRKRLNYD